MSGLTSTVAKQSTKLKNVKSQWNPFMTKNGSKHDYSKNAPNSPVKTPQKPKESNLFQSMSPISINFGMEMQSSRKLDRTLHDNIRRLVVEESERQAAFQKLIGSSRRY